jgi:hypothetical protein
LEQLGIGLRDSNDLNLGAIPGCVEKSVDVPVHEANDRDTEGAARRKSEMAGSHSE